MDKHTRAIIRFVRAMQGTGQFKGTNHLVEKDKRQANKKGNILKEI